MSRRSWMLAGWCICVVGLLWEGRAGLPRTGNPDFEALREKAETLFTDGSYARAQALYTEALDWEMDETDARWRDFRIQDARWRSADSSRQPDDSAFREAGEELLRMVRDRTKSEEQDRIWAEIQESLGDYYWLSHRQSNWGLAWNSYYRQALDWWAGAPEIETARARYLGIVRRLNDPDPVHPGRWRPGLPLEILENAHRIAVTETDRARTALFLAEGLRRGASPRQMLRIEPLFEQALAIGKASGVYDDALMSLAQWLASQGRPEQDEHGNWRYVRDYKGALEYYRRLLREYREGESRHVPNARRQVEAITRTELTLHATSFFLPQSEIEIRLNWRNAGQVHFSLHGIDLPRDVDLRQGKEASWLESVRLDAGEPVREWRHDTGDRGEHQPGSAVLRLEALPSGAYVLTAHAGGRTVRELVLVTDLAVMVKHAPGRALVYVCDAVSGEPVPDARIALWRMHGDRHWDLVEGRADGSGAALLDLPERENPRRLMVFVSLGQRQAFVSKGVAGAVRRSGDDWRLYAFSDRTAYRPGDSVQWKVVARRLEGGVYHHPAGQTLYYTIRDPRGGEAGKGRLDLNAFGAAWDSLELGNDLPLGMYRVEFHTTSRGRGTIGATDLFRLEEYKLPEFMVTVEAPRDGDGAPLTFLPGEEIGVTVRAAYYFGGPVLDADVEIIVREYPFRFDFPEHREFPWLHAARAAAQPRHFPGGGGQIVAREQTRTDGQGEARLAFTPPVRGEQDREYRIEARVTDASRREIAGSGIVRVTRNRYYVQARPERWIHRPGDRAGVTFTALDPNGRPVLTEGRVRVVREQEHEIWIRADGREVFGEALRRAREEARVWPPPEWRRRLPGRERDEILDQTLRTASDGTAQLSFTPEREGRYLVYWSSPQRGGPRIQADTMIWAADRETTELGVRVGRLQLISDRESFRSGEEAPVMLVAPSSGRHVLFSVEAEDLLHWDVIHMAGSVKLLRVPVGEEHIPHAWLSALMVQDAEMHQADEEMIVPPHRRYLEVSAVPESETVKPGAPSVWNLTVRDHAGHPVEAEIAFGLTDEAVFYIQEEIAGDPRAFFFDARRPRRVTTRGSFQEKPYRRLDPEPPPDPSPPEIMRPEEGAQRAGMLREMAVGGEALAARGPGMDLDGRVMAADQVMAAPRRRAEVAAQEADPAPEAVVRADFRATAFWRPDLRTDANGRVSVSAPMPESLTAWRGVARVGTRSNEFGFAEAVVRTRLPLMARLQAPRFLVAGDEAVIAALIDNHTDGVLEVIPQLEMEGLTLLEQLVPESGTLTVPAGENARAEWRVRAHAAGEAMLRVTARGGGHADAMQRPLPVHEHGLERAVTAAGKVDADRAEMRIHLPAERRAGSTSLRVQVTPSLAAAMLDALPYLAHYPYGCTEQTMSRFLPAVVVARTFESLGLSPEAVEGRLFGGIERGDERTHPRGRGDLRKLDDMVRAGLARLYDFQHASGGWGWWKEGDTDPFMSAYIVWGLALAREAGVEVRPAVLDRGRDYLRRTLVEQERRPDLQAWMLHALSVLHAGGEAHAFETAARDNLWERHAGLNAYARALLALAEHRFGRDDRARLLARNLENGVKYDASPDTSIVLGQGRAAHPLTMATARWGEDGIVRRWSDGGVEATAFALQAMLTIVPESEWVAPAMNWLVKNRRGAQWSNTRDTAIVLLVLNDYLLQSGELTREGAFRVSVNGRAVAAERFGPGETPAGPSLIEVDPALLRDGTNRIRIEREGEGPLYVSARAEFYSLECPIPAGGHELFVRRRYYRYIGRPTLLKGLVYDRVPLCPGDRVRSGDRIETVLTIEAKNHYEYLVFEDLKPAGFEAVEVRSGGPFRARELNRRGAERRMDDAAWAAGEARGEQAVLEEQDYTGRSRWVYREWRDRHVALFIDRLPEGFWEMRYEMRAETPGVFHGLPVTGHAMYVPELRCNGDEQMIEIGPEK